MSATSKITYTGNLHTRAIHLASGAVIETDAPKDNNGLGEAFSPTDLCATSLASCMMTVMAIGARERGINIVHMEGVMTKGMAASPRRISRIGLDITLSIEPDTSQNRASLERIGRACPVTLSLHPDVEQVITYRFQQPS